MTKADVAVMDWLRKHAEPTAPALFSMSREDAQRLVAMLDQPPSVRLVICELWPCLKTHNPITLTPGDELSVKDGDGRPFLGLQVR